MIQRIDLRGQSLGRRALLDVLPRAEVGVDEAVHVVEPLLRQVREGGAASLREISLRLDGIAPQHLRVPATALADALDGLAPLVRRALEESIRRVRRVHAEQLPADHVTDVAPGAVVRQRWIPVQRVGLYVPGGLAVYPSSVVMSVVAAQEAGVPGLAVTSPPQKDNGGLPHPTILAACAGCTPSSSRPTT